MPLSTVNSSLPSVDLAYYQMRYLEGLETAVAAAEILYNRTGQSPLWSERYEQVASLLLDCKLPRNPLPAKEPDAQPKE